MTNPPRISDNDRIREAYVKLVRQIGPGFHPETPSDGYEPKLEDPVSYTRIVNAMFYSGQDPFRVGLDIFVEEGWMPLECLLPEEEQ